MTCLVLLTYTSLFGLAGLLANSSGACHFFLPGSSLWLELSNVLAYKSSKPQSFAVQILLTSTLRALMLQWRRSLLWRNSYRERRGKKRCIPCSHDVRPWNWAKISNDTLIGQYFDLLGILLFIQMLESFSEIVLITLYSPVQNTHVRPWWRSFSLSSDACRLVQHYPIWDSVIFIKARQVYYFYSTFHTQW